VYEITANLHIHTKFSDGSKTHQQVIDAALDSNLDVIFFTDHNIYTDGIEGYHINGDNKLLAIMGEEVHDSCAEIQKNHLLSLGAEKSLCQFAFNNQLLIKRIQKFGGISVIAHPHDPAMPAFNEPDISWEDSSITGVNGVEIWNGFSELKVRANKKWQAYFYGFFPKLLPQSPPKSSVAFWEKFLDDGQKITALGGSDAHAIHFSAGFLNKVIFPYKYHFQSINSHLKLSSPLTGDYEKDKPLILKAIKNGNVFIANDLISQSKGFQFQVRDRERFVQMGESGRFQSGMKLIVDLPQQADCLIFKNGGKIHTMEKTKGFSWDIPSPGRYRVECHKRYLFKQRTWIFSNPIYLT